MNQSKAWTSDVVYCHSSKTTDTPHTHRPTDLHSNSEMQL